MAHPNWKSTPIYIRRTWFKIYAAKELGRLPTLMELFDRTHKNKAGAFVDEKSEKIYNDVAARIDERETQLAQESADGSPVVLSTIEVDRIYEEVAPKKENLILLYEENITSLINEEMATNLLLRQSYNDETPFIAISSLSKYDVIGNYRTSFHPYKIGFFHATFVAKPNDFPSEVPEKYLADYTEIPGGKADNSCLVDVIGQIVNFGSLEKKMIKGKDNMRLLIELRDQNNEKMMCTLWGRYAKQVYDYSMSNMSTMIICVSSLLLKSGKVYNTSIFLK
uniref:DUF223 domain-containing protein n=1 Tax=Brassica oleracea var. oleracea TaxID=109376 RepID=A0A0D3BK12_BRAOL